ncbi:DUF5990 family protein [Micromonospora sp. NPDC006431]|uniref:DUF5990 family protein n=1 Tax=Micromonospora sp. NPDC006431 TaxID=3364235 RepID=UPI00369BD4DB
MRIRIEGHDLPGRDCGGSDDFPGYRNIHVGVQRRERPTQWLDLQPGDAAAVRWDLDCTAATVTKGGLDVRGPYIQGGPGRRFIYLSWGEVDRTGTFTMFRRAKLWIDGVENSTAHAAISGGRLIARLGLTDAKGHPLCAAVRPPKVTWSAT